MAETSSIEWTDATFNIVMGCTKVSEACQFCYAEREDKRGLYERGVSHWGPNAPRHTWSADYWKNPLRWNAKAEREGRKMKVFCSSLADVFEDHPTVAGQRLRLWELIGATPNLIWLLLTKRPENMETMFPRKWITGGLPQNVWAMASTENQRRFDERVGHLLKIPAVVRGFSCEPLLGPISFGDHFQGVDPKSLWIIAGGESSNSKAQCRPSQVDWFRGLRDQSQPLGIPFLFKQWGNWNEGDTWGKKSYRVLDAKEHNGFPAQ